MGFRSSQFSDPYWMESRPRTLKFHYYYAHRPVAFSWNGVHCCHLCIFVSYVSYSHDFATCQLIGSVVFISFRSRNVPRRLGGGAKVLDTGNGHRDRRQWPSWSPSPRCLQRNPSTLTCHLLSWVSLLVVKPSSWVAIETKNVFFYSSNQSNDRKYYKTMEISDNYNHSKH